MTTLDIFMMVPSVLLFVFSLWAIFDGISYMIEDSK
jgi:hypothetical protein